VVSVFGLQPGTKWVTPVTYNWNLTVERQLRSDMVGHISYVGLRGTHLRQDVDLNPAVYTPGNTAGTNARRPFQPFGDILENRNNGASSYNALQVDIEKRPSAGSAGVLKYITLLANYTYSKAIEYGLSSNGGITDVGSSKGSGRPFGDPLQPAFETGVSDFDHTHRLVASFVWDLPKLSGANHFAKWALGGWQWTGIYSYTTGDPLTITAGKDQSQTGLGADRADFVGTSSQYGGVASEGDRKGCPGTGTCVAWLNTSVFALPAVGTYGTSGKNAFRGPSRWNTDMGLIKNFTPLSSHENFNVQFRGEFFNLFNHPQLNNPELNFSSANFGGIRSTVGGSADYRVIQLALKVSF
jgi:hypothetical protein